MKSYFFRSFIAAITVLMLFLGLLAGIFPYQKSADVLSNNIRNIPYTLVIDAGHGGADGGAVSLTGTYESSINLAIALKAEQIAAFFGIDPVMTRSSENINYPQSADTIKKKKIADQRQRAETVNSLDDPFFISIHQNKYTSSGPRGAQTFYGNSEISKSFADNLQNLLISQLDDSNNRPAAKISDNIYLMKNIACPSVLIECGFLSNKNEALLLENSEYQTKISTLIIGEYINYVENSGEYK